MAWQYKREETNFEIPAGIHRVVIDSAEKGVSKADNDMLVIKLRVSGCSGLLWHYIVFLDSHPEVTNARLTQMFDSFGIADGDFELAHYVGKAGAAKVKIDENGYAKVAYFIPKHKQADLPPWKGKLPTTENGMVEVNDEDFPFC